MRARAHTRQGALGGTRQGAVLGKQAVSRKVAGCACRCWDISDRLAPCGALTGEICSWTSHHVTQASIRGPHLARQLSLSLLESTTAAPPTRNRQLGMSMLRWLPKYLPTPFAA